MYILGFNLPLWTIFLGGIIIVIAAWKFIKFAIKILLILIAFFAILVGLDYLHVFEFIQNLLSSIT